MKHTSNKIRWSAIAGLATIAIAGLVGACNSHPVEFTQATNSVSVHSDVSPDTAAAVDILWVIDNSGSMCQEQSALRANFQKFISQITDRNIDFHLGVTTTHMEAYPLETVARPGYLQSEPQPLPSSLAECLGDEGDPNVSDDGYSQIREAIDLAIECSKDPAKWEHLRGVTDLKIGCEMRQPDENCDCTNNENEVGPGTPLCNRTNLFPTYEDGVSPYREIDKVLKYSAYLNETTGRLDEAGLADLEADFACMSFVGTSGNSIEKGLEAATLAVSPEMTGGTVENPTDESAPNYGLLRDSAKFSVIFVTDENDCSHGDAELDKRTPGCGVDICSMANHPDWEGTPLTPPEDLAQKLKDKLSGSKGYEVKDDSIIAASIHGRSKPYGADSNYPAGQPPRTVAECNALPSPISESIEQQTSCDTPDFGTAYSGDRYESFLREFDAKQVFPRIPADANLAMDGLICDPTRIDNTLEQIGETIAGSVSSCITNVPFSCSADEDCPAYAFGEGTEQCLPFGESSDSYCNSGIQVRLYPGDNTLADLENHEYCVPGSIDSTMVPGGCVVDPTQYAFSACPGAETSAISLNWTDSRYFNTLSGYDVELVYTLLTGEPQASANNGDGAAN